MNEVIRVLQVVTHMNRGGLESMIMNYYRNVDRSKVQFDFLTHRPETEKKDYDDEINSLGGIIYHLPRLNPVSSIYLEALNAFFANHKEYKIIHVHQDCMSSIILKAARNNGIPVRIAHCHSSSQDKGIKYYIKSYYKRKIKKEATQLFACGKKSGEWMFGTTDFTILPNAIDAEVYRFNKEKRTTIRKQLNLNDSFVIGHVGRFNKVKNHCFLINVFEEILKQENKSRLILVGVGEKQDDIKRLVEKKGIVNQVVFAGLRSDINDLMQAFDVFVLPSLYEGLPVTMIEAQAAGLPCVISGKVPLDCKITNNVFQISLAESLQEWANEICKLKGTKREDTISQIVAANYDIKKNAEKLQKYYLWQLKKCRQD